MADPRTTDAADAKSLGDTQGTGPDPVTVLTELRRFHLGGPPPEWGTAPTGLLPRQLAQFRGRQGIRHEYPWVLSTDTDRTASDDPAPSGPLRDLLPQWLARSGTEAGDRVLVDTLTRLEQDVRDAFRDDPSADRPRDLLKAAGQKLLGSLKLNAEHTRTLENGLNALLAAVPEDARLLAFEGETLPVLAAHALAQTIESDRARLRERLQRLCDGLSRLLDVERARDPQSWTGGPRQGTDSDGTGYLDLARMAEVVGSPRGARRMEPARLARIEAAHTALESYLQSRDGEPVIFVGPGSRRAATSGHGVVSSFWRETEEDVCEAVVAVFDEVAADAVPLFRAARVARLELDDAYDPAQHDPWFEQFDVEALGADELRCLPAVCGIVERTALILDNGVGLSRALRSLRPIHLFVEVDPLEIVKDALEGSSLPVDFGYLAISHRTAFVHQSTLAWPDRFVAGVRQSRSASCPAVHLIAVPPGSSPAALDPWLEATAALEGRAHPLFVYDPTRGHTWAERFSIEGNPDPESPWPTGDAGLSVPDHTGTPGSDPMVPGDPGESVFTYAEFALLRDTAAAHLREVPEGLHSDDLVPVQRAVTLDASDVGQHVPYLHAVDAGGREARYVVTRRLVACCRDRLDFWHTVQELAGVQNQHVLEAMARVREEGEAAAREALLAAEAAHRQQTEEVRQSAAGEVLQQLARALVATDPLDVWPGASRGGGGASVGPVSSQATAGPAPRPANAADAAITLDVPPSPPSPKETAAPAPTKPATVSEDPWIDTPLCTSCNDCRAINSMLFLYDDSKQAYIGDPRAGTFEDLVRAAEKCPARCIHPGTPLDPNEPNLEALIARAAPFN